MGIRLNAKQHRNAFSASNVLLGRAMSDRYMQRQNALFMFVIVVGTDETHNVICVRIRPIQSYAKCKMVLLFDFIHFNPFLLRLLIYSAIQLPPPVAVVSSEIL